MRILFCPFILLLFLTGCSSDDSLNEPVNSPVDDPNEVVEWTFINRMDLSSPERATVDGINEFSFALMKEMADASIDGQFNLSPVSVAIYLGMLANATSGDINAQIFNVLGAGSIETLNSTCEKFMRYLPYEKNGSCISVSNRFWVADSYNVPEVFRSIMASSFNALVESVDFTKPTTVPAINQWVYDNTRGLIPSLLDGDWKDYVSIPMANANTVYFKGHWLNKFDTKNTKTEKFQTPQGPEDVSMMRRSIKTAYISTDLVEMVSLEFEGPKNTMYIYLPTQGVSVKQLISEFTPALQADLCSSAELCDVTLGLPRFESRADCNLNAALGSLGITSLDEADFSPMGLGMLPVETIHKTNIKIDEDGAEMVALTGGWCTLSGPSASELKKVAIDFNRPFVYLVRNDETGAILMAGTVVRP